MSSHDEYDHLQEEAFNQLLEEQLHAMATGPVIEYLAKYGDAIEKRVRCCIEEANSLRNAGFFGAALARSVVDIEITIRFLLTRPLLSGAFLSDEWAAILSEKIWKGRSADDRDLLPAILRQWGIDITKVLLSNKTQVWGKIKGYLYDRRNEYIHKGASIEESDAILASECVDTLIKKIIDPIAVSLGFTREQTGLWSVVIPKMFPEINPPHRYETASPFDKKQNT